MTAAAYRGIAPRACAESSFRITVKTLETETAPRNAQNVPIAAFAGDANGGIRALTSPIGVSTATLGLASSGDSTAVADDLRCARLHRCRLAIRAAGPSPQRGSGAARTERYRATASRLGDRARAGRGGRDRTRGRLASG